MTNWKSTLAGILTIVAALIGLGITYLSTGTIPSITTLTTLLGPAFTTAIGYIVHGFVTTAPTATATK